MPADWTIARTVEEIEVMADAWLACDQSVCPWTEGAAKVFGGEAAWVLMGYVPKYLKEGCAPEPLDDAAALEGLEERLDFLLEKASNERGISAPKAREQVCAYLWLFGRDEYIRAGQTFAQLALRAQELLHEVRAVRNGTAAS